MQAEIRASTCQTTQLLRLAQSAVEEIDGAVHASIAVMSDGDLTTVVSTDATIEAVGNPCGGPSLAAVRTGRIIRLPTVARNSEFPEFAAACRSHHISSAASFPIKIAERGTIGCLTIRSADHHGFCATDLRLGRRTADCIATEFGRST